MVINENILRGIIQEAVRNVLNEVSANGADVNTGIVPQPNKTGASNALGGVNNSSQGIESASNTFYKDAISRIVSQPWFKFRNATINQSMSIDAGTYTITIPQGTQVACEKIGSQVSPNGSSAWAWVENPYRDKAAFIQRKNALCASIQNKQRQIIYTIRQSNAYNGAEAKSQLRQGPGGNMNGKFKRDFYLVAMSAPDIMRKQNNQSV